MSLHRVNFGTSYVRKPVAWKMSRGCDTDVRFGSKADILARNAMSALPPKATLDTSFRISAKGQKRTYAAHQEGSLFDHRASADEQVKKAKGPA